MHANGIVLSMEMDEEGFRVTPSFACEVAVMGVALYPALAQLAGLGWMGKSGILITPEHGPRVRLGAIFTNIENLPNTATSTHALVADYCEGCRICVKKSPVDAISDKPVDRSKDQMIFVDTDTCFPQFADHDGCGVCIGVCPFNKKPYEEIKSSYHHKKG